jgi:hypothetical protein
MQRVRKALSPWPQAEKVIACLPHAGQIIRGMAEVS